MTAKMFVRPSFNTLPTAPRPPRDERRTVPARARIRDTATKLGLENALVPCVEAAGGEDSMVIRALHALSLVEATNPDHRLMLAYAMAVLWQMDEQETHGELSKLFCVECGEERDDNHEGRRCPPCEGEAGKYHRGDDTIVGMPLPVFYE